MKLCRRCLSPALGSLALAVPALSTSQAQVSIVIPNFSFESPSTGTFAAFSGSNWTTTGDAGVTSFASIKTKFSAGNAPDGAQIAFLNTQGGIISQTLSTTFEPGLTYTLTGWIGHRTDNTNVIGSIALYDHTGLQLATSGSVSPASGTFQSVTLSYLATSADSGNKIRVVLTSVGAGQVNFDAIQLSAIPEPATWSAIAGFVVLCAAILQRRRARARSRAQSARAGPHGPELPVAPVGGE